MVLALLVRGENLKPYLYRLTALRTSVTISEILLVILKKN
jgi:hypothetical protein